MDEYVYYDDNDPHYRDTPLASPVPKPTLSYIKSLGPIKTRSKRSSTKRTFFKKPQQPKDDKLSDGMNRLMINHLD